MESIKKSMAVQDEDGPMQANHLQFHTPAKTEKVSDHIIEQIRDAILSGRYKPGDRLASEKELVDGFGVSKASVREALRVLEVMGLVEIRKGVSGGVFIAQVDMKTTIHSIMNFLHFTSLSARDITMVRYLLEPSVARWAAATAQPDDFEKLARMIHTDPGGSELEREIGFHRYLTRLTQNPLLILIMDFIDNLLRELKVRIGLKEEFYVKVRTMHLEILDCLIRRDGEAAARCMTRDLLQVGDDLAEATGTPRFDPRTLGAFNPLSLLSGSPLKVVRPGPADHLDSGLAREIKDKGLLLQDLGSGRLYVFSPDEDQEE